MKHHDECPTQRGYEACACDGYRERDGLQQKLESVNSTLKHLGLEPWPDGRSVTDGKRPWEQHISMVISSLKAEADGSKLQVGEITAHRDRLRDLLNDIRGMVWKSMETGNQLDPGTILNRIERDVTEKRFPEALAGANEQYGEVFKRLAQGATEDARLLKLQLARAQVLAEAASGVLSPCDLESEKERGYCVGHGGITRLPCEFAELRAALEAFRAKEQK